MYRHRSTDPASILLMLVCLALMIGGCVTSRERHHSSSVVDFLYPNTKNPVIQPGIPTLTLPLNVGIAFVPSSGYQYGAGILSEKSRMDLMQKVADHFKKYPFVRNIELIPSAYLKSKGGFANLDQVRTMFGVDVIALVSYDQVQFTDEGLLGLTYWTIVGAYVVPGEKNDTHTMLDTVVYDIRSRRLLFRAPGVHHVGGRATPINLSEQLRLDSQTGFDGAAQDMIANLDQQLALFKDKVKARPEEYRVVHSPGYSGGGSIDALVLALVLLLAGGYAWQRRTNGV